MAADNTVTFCVKIQQPHTALWHDAGISCEMLNWSVCFNMLIYGYLRFCSPCHVVRPASLWNFRNVNWPRVNGLIQATAAAQFTNSWAGTVTPPVLRAEYIKLEEKQNHWFILCKFLMYSWSRRFRRRICSGWSLMEVVVVLLTVTLGRLQQPEESVSRKHKSHVIQNNALDLVYVAWTLHNISQFRRNPANCWNHPSPGGFRKRQ